MRSKSHQNGALMPKIVTKRNRYFTGKYMTAQDFINEQSYFLSRHRLHNRLLHGWGILAGLRVENHPTDRCKHNWVVVRAGIAIDCYGRELILEKDTPFLLPEDRDEGLLCLAYTEELIEQAPVLYSEDVCVPIRTEASRVSEVACLKLLPMDQVESECWPHEKPEAEHRCQDDCDDQLPAPVGDWLEPICACAEGIVPLAHVKYVYQDAGSDEVQSPVQIDQTGRHTLPISPDFRTHIVDISWRHGGEMSVDALQDCNGHLTVTFDRKLLEAPHDGWGVNEFTFTIQYWGAQHSPEYLPGNVSLSEDHCKAIFTIEESFLKNLKKIIHDTISISLKCDFILDCHGEPVDGNYLRGQLPSGNGTPGGLFESWFRVAPEA
jgi:hypothetical protein